MSVNDMAVEPDAPGGELELLTDDEGVWTVVPTDAEGEERLTRWISVEADQLRDLDEWR